METYRFNFQRFKEEHFEDYLSLVSNQNVMKMITGIALSREEAFYKFQGIIKTNSSENDYGIYRVTMKQDNTFIGIGKIVKVDEKEAEIGYSLLPEHWHKGFGTEISEKLVETASSNKSLEYLIAIVDPVNYASKRILIKCNFTMRKRCMLEGLPAEIFELQLKKI
jgi:hypothetical protein